MDSLPVNATDILVIVVVVISGIFAFVRGFVHELCGIGAWIGAAFATLYGFPYVQPYARDIISVELLADITAGIVLFILVLVSLSLLTRLVSERVRDSSLGPLDRSLGLVFGFLRGAVLVCLGWLALTWALPPEDWPDWVVEARTRPLMQEGTKLLRGLLPPESLEEGSAAAEEALRRAEQANSFRRLVSPLPNPDGQAAQPEYNDAMRQSLQDAIEDFARESPEAAGSPAEGDR